MFSMTWTPSRLSAAATSTGALPIATAERAIGREYSSARLTSAGDGCQSACARLPALTESALKFLGKIRPNIVLGLVCLLAISLAATLALPPDDSKEILLVVAAGMVALLKDLLDEDKRGD